MRCYLANHFYLFYVILLIFSTLLCGGTQISDKTGKIQNLLQNLNSTVGDENVAFKEIANDSTLNDTNSTNDGSAQKQQSVQLENSSIVKNSKLNSSKLTSDNITAVDDNIKTTLKSFGQNATSNLTLSSKSREKIDNIDNEIKKVQKSLPDLTTESSSSTTSTRLLSTTSQVNTTTTIVPTTATPLLTVENSDINEIKVPERKMNEDDGVEDAKEEQILSDSNVVESDSNVKQSSDQVVPVYAEPPSSHFMFYMICIGMLVLLAYLIFHNKKKILGLILEGRRKSNDKRRRNITYKKLQAEDPTEAILSKGSMDVIY